MTLRRFLPGSLALLVGVAAPGCATKHDIRDLQSQLALAQAQQDSLFRVLQGQNRALVDSVRNTTDLLVRVRGDLGHQLLDLEQQIVQVQELTGQSQRRLQDLNAQLQQRQEQLQVGLQPDTGARPLPLPPGMPAQVGTPPATSAADLFGLAQSQLQNGATGTARIAFQQLLRNFPNDTLAAAAQFGLAETYAQEDAPRAIREFDRVVELYPNSSQAPAALLRAGTLAQTQGNVARAREYLQRILARYPDAPEAAQARRRLQGLHAPGEAAGSSARKAGGKKKKTQRKVRAHGSKRPSASASARKQKRD